ncbi:hypothetical protein BDV59DRAFT_193372 [Aspergillus ambiguus]|uniref:uncharacterized protein n=1 Tax=Aspergillus ambiguus TaxID=176160 RepID=UPI003CCCBDF4
MPIIEKVNTPEDHVVPDHEAKLGETSLYVDKDAESSYVRKVDLFVLPLLCLSNLANAKTDGLDRDINMEGNDYSLLVLLFYIPFGLFDLPWNLLIKRFSGRLMLSITTIVWGVLAMCQYAAKDFGSMLAIRIILGVFEAGFFCGAAFYFTLFYTRGEMGFRLAIMQSFAVLASAFSGLISFGVFQINYSPVHSWQWLFIIEGSMTLITDIVSFWWLPDNACSAWFLNDRERAAAKTRLLRDTSSETWKDWKFPIWCIITFTYPVAYATAMNFFPRIVQRLGYSVVKTNLWTVAPNLVGAVVLLCVPKSSDYFRERMFLIIFSLVLSLVAAGAYIPSCLVHAWHNNNNVHENSRAANTGFFVGLGNIAGVLSAATFRTEYAPKYIPTLVTTCCCNEILSGSPPSLCSTHHGSANMKNHSCQWPNCDKSFTRAEHLRRHALNHEQAHNGYTSRHMMRHAKRDEEAGGPGLGVLETRKRTRRVGDGTIITRPPKRQPRAAVSQSTGLSSISVASSQDQQIVEPDGHTPHGAPVSPPGSASDHPSLSLDDTDSLIAPMMPGGPFEPYVEPIPGQFDAADGSFSLGLDGTADFFNIDTATDFNMPFAAIHNYNWLFDVASLDDAFLQFDMPLGSDITAFTDTVVPDRDSFSLPEMKPLFGQDGSSVLLQAASYVERGTCAEMSEPIGIPDIVDLEWMTGSSVFETHLPPHLPQLNEESRQNILTLVAQTPPLGADGGFTPLYSPLLSVESLQSYCDLFFTRFNKTYPLIHQATFDPNRIEPIFLAAILSMGATYSSREAHQLAVGIHDSLRNQLFCHKDFSPQPDLWVLQTLLLIDCFGKMRAGPRQRERAQLFHCVLIKLIRRSNCCTIRTPCLSNQPVDMNEAWRHAMTLEQRKRLAMHCFMWDTQHAVLFSQSLCMSAFEIRSSLPCSAAAWEATNAEDWARHASHDQEQIFLTVLKAYITPSAVSRPRDINSLARIVILHGLMSTTLRSETPERMGAWTPRIGRSYDLWKADFDADCLAIKLSQTADPARFIGFKTAAHALYRAAHLALNVEVLDLQIAAGASQILGRTVASEDRERSRRQLPRWLHGELGGSLVAARHAAYLIHDALLTLHDWDQTESFHFSWCLYLATLTCWAFHSGMEEHPSKDRTPSDLSSLIVAMTTCSTTPELAAISGKYDTRGLVMVMAQQLAAVRWAVVHDAMKVLMNLSK